MSVEFGGLPIIRAPGRSGGSTTWPTVAEEAGQERSDESDESDEGDEGQCWIRGKDLSYRQLLHVALRPVRCWDHALHYTRVWGIE